MSEPGEIPSNDLNGQRASELLPLVYDELRALARRESSDSDSSADSSEDREPEPQPA